MNDNSKKAPESAPVKAEKSVAEAIAEGIQKGLVEAIPLAVAMSNKTAQPQAAAAPARGGYKDHGNRCGLCQQYETACKGEHEKMVVFPRSSRHAKWFQGLHINGVRYLSNNSQHYIWVPKANNFAYMIEQFEANEDSLNQGREASHNSGNLGGGGAGFNPANQGWR